MDPSEQTEPEPQDPEQPLQRNRKPTGKIANLPRQIREQLNFMLSDGLTYPQVIERLGEAGKELNVSNLKRWHAGPYQRWLKDRAWLDEMTGRLDFATNVLETPECPKIREASLIIAVKQMYDLLASFDPVAFKEKLGEDPASYSRLLNALSKLAEVGLRYDHERTETVRSAARENQKSRKTAGLTDDMLRQYESEFKLLRRPPLPTTSRPAEPAEKAANGAEGR